MWLTHFWHSWSQFFIFAWDVTAGGILRTGILICLVGSDNGLAPGRCQAIILTSVRILLIGHLGPVKKSQWNSDQNSNIFIQQNVFENVLSKMAAILSRPQCAKGRLQKMGQCPLVDKITYIFGVKVIGPSRTNYSNIQTKHKQFL